MDNFQIERLCKSIKQLQNYFLGVFASDQIPARKKIRQNKFCIVNLDPSYKDGSHWIAIIFSPHPKKDFYFDSYGEPPPPALRKHLKKSFNRNYIQLQHPLSTACGQWCIFFCCAYFSNHSLKEISKFFRGKANLLTNDFLVNKFVNKILPHDEHYKVIDRKFLKKQFAVSKKCWNV